MLDTTMARVVTPAKKTTATVINYNDTFVSTLGQEDYFISIRQLYRNRILLTKL